MNTIKGTLSNTFTLYRLQKYDIQDVVQRFSSNNPIGQVGS